MTAHYQVLVNSLWRFQVLDPFKVDVLGSIDCYPRTALSTGGQALSRVGWQLSIQRLGWCDPANDLDPNFLPDSCWTSLQATESCLSV